MVYKAINNDTIWKDTKDNEILAQGGDVLKVGDIYYWFGAGFGSGSDYEFYNIKCYSSLNLINWKFENNVLSRQPSGSLSKEHWIGRPSVIYNSITKNYVMIFEWNSFGVARNRVAFAQCSTICGVYNWVGSSIAEGRSFGDMAVYKDTDENAYLLTVMDEGIDLEDGKEVNYSLAIFKLQADYCSLKDKIFEGFEMSKREATYIIKKEGIYYWFSSDMRGWESSETKYSTAVNLAGPWSALKPVANFPNTDNSYNSQHDFIITVQGSDTTSYIYCGDRYSNFHGTGTGRYMWTPLTFIGGEPEIHWFPSWKIDAATGIWTESNA